MTVEVPNAASDSSESPKSPPQPVPVVVFMGVAGCGKTAVGQAAAQLLGCEFVEGDAFHSPANVEKMKNGMALTDEERLPWLRALREHLEAKAAKLRETWRPPKDGGELPSNGISTEASSPERENLPPHLPFLSPRVAPCAFPPRPLLAPVVVCSCSALKRSYRDELSAVSDPSLISMHFVYLRGTRELLQRRIESRHGHFMKSGMLESQLATLEEPTEVELKNRGGLLVDIAPPPPVVARRALEAACERGLLPLILAPNNRVVS